MGYVRRYSEYGNERPHHHHASMRSHGPEEVAQRFRRSQVTASTTGRHSSAILCSQSGETFDVA